MRCISTRGRANTLRLALTGQLGADAMSSDALHEAMALCVSCKACKRECPTGVDMAKMKIEVAAARADRYGTSWKETLIAELPRIAPIVSRMAGAGQSPQSRAAAALAVRTLVRPGGLASGADMEQQPLPRRGGRGCRTCLAARVRVSAGRYVQPIFRAGKSAGSTQGSVGCRLSCHRRADERTPAVLRPYLARRRTWSTARGRRRCGRCGGCRTTFRSLGSSRPA